MWDKKVMKNHAHSKLVELQKQLILATTKEVQTANETATEQSVEETREIREWSENEIELLELIEYKRRTLAWNID